MPKRTILVFCGSGREFARCSAGNLRLLGQLDHYLLAAASSEQSNGAAALV
jgi:hypothetical protein